MVIYANCPLDVRGTQSTASAAMLAIGGRPAHRRRKPDDDND